MSFSTSPSRLLAGRSELVRVVAGICLAAAVGTSLYLVAQQLPSLTDVRALLLAKFLSYQGFAAQVAPFMFGGLMVAQIVNALLCVVGRRLKSRQHPCAALFTTVMPLMLCPVVFATALMSGEEPGNFDLFWQLFTGLLLLTMSWTGAVIFSDVNVNVNVDQDGDDFYGNPVAYLARSKVVLGLAYLAMGFTPLTFAAWVAMSALDYFLCPMGKMPRRKKQVS